MASATFTSDDVDHIAGLANIPVTEEEKKSLSKGFTATLKVIDNLQIANTSGTKETHQVTYQENVLREDRVDEEKMFSQDEALRNAPKTHKGYFVVKQVLER
jgi:aspartyl-tRNA(Asn)/glutamyl-tRNA(Gln) amidotransferase subunit C